MLLKQLDMHVPTLVIKYLKRAISVICIAYIYSHRPIVCILYYISCIVLEAVYLASRQQKGDDRLRKQQPNGGRETTKQQTHARRTWSMSIGLHHSISGEELKEQRIGGEREEDN